MASTAVDYRVFRWALMLTPIGASLLSAGALSIFAFDARYIATFIFYLQLILMPASLLLWIYLRRKNMTPPTYYGPKFLNDSFVFNVAFNLTTFVLCFAAYYFVTFIHVEILPTQLQGGFFRATRVVFVQAGAYSFTLMQAFEVVSNLTMSSKNHDEGINQDV